MFIHTESGRKSLSIDKRRQNLGSLTTQVSWLPSVETMAWSFLRCSSNIACGMESNLKFATFHHSAPAAFKSRSQIERMSLLSQNPWGFSGAGFVSSNSSPTHAPQSLRAPVSALVPDLCMPSTRREVRERFWLTVLRITGLSFMAFGSKFGGNAGFICKQAEWMAESTGGGLGDSLLLNNT